MFCATETRDFLYLVFDVESIGIHGEGFAFGWVLITRRGREMCRGLYFTSPDLAKGSETDRAWVAEHIPPLGRDGETPSYFLPSPEELRKHVWLVLRGIWSKYAGDDPIVMAADCPFPVEYNFLEQMLRENGPLNKLPLSDCSLTYPLLDIGSLRHGAGLDAVGTESRLPEELPVHDPMRDSRQSARLLVQALDICSGRNMEPTY